MKQIAVKISDDAYERLQRFAHQGKTTYAVIVENAIAAYQPSEFDSEPTSEIQALIEAALAPVLERLATLESMGLVKPLNPEQGVVVTVDSAHQEAHQGGATGQEVVEAVADKIAPEIAPGAAVDQIEREAALSTPTADYLDVSESKPVAEETKKPIAFADLPDDQKQHWRRVMLDWQQQGMSNPKISQRLWDEQRIGQYNFGNLAPMDRNRVKIEIDRIKKGK
jgi:predicted transcriptional regulator